MLFCRAWKYRRMWFSLFLGQDIGFSTTFRQKIIQKIKLYMGLGTACFPKRLWHQIFSQCSIFLYIKEVQFDFADWLYYLATRNSCPPIICASTNLLDHSITDMTLPFASGTFLSATATALMTMSFTETLTSCCSVIEEVKWMITQSTYMPKKLN